MEDDSAAREAAIDKMRNKSRLAIQHQNMVRDELPYPEPVIWIHHTLLFARRMYGRYGESSGVNPSVCWPTQKELASIREMERVAHPLTIQQMVENVRREKHEAEERIHARQAEVVKNMANLEKMKQAFYNKIAKKEADVQAIKVIWSETLTLH